MEPSSRYRIIDTFCNKVLNDKKYYRHCDIEFTVNIKITGIMNYFDLFDEEELEFISRNHNKNLKYINEIDSNKNAISEDKKKIKAELIKQKTRIPDEKELTLLSFKFPEFELFLCSLIKRSLY